MPGAARQAGHPPNVQRKADQEPFSLHLLLAPHMEPTEPESFLDPSVRRFRQPLPLGVGSPALRRCQVFPHPVRGVPPIAVDGGVLPAFPSQRHMASDSPCLQRGEIRFVAVAGVRKHLRRHLPARCRGRVQHGQQLPLIRRPSANHRGNDHLVLPIHRNLRQHA